jgi:lysophospholipase L1-like esterase
VTSHQASWRGQAATAAAPAIQTHWRELLLAIGSLAFLAAVLVAIEGGWRLVDPQYLDHRPQASLALLHHYSEIYGWEPRPGAVTFVDGQRTTINAQGLRGSVHPLARTGRPRVVLLGDSVAFGYGVADDDTFAARLEERGYEVVNLAVPGYGTDQELLRFERVGAAYRPDVVLLHFCAHNDFADNASRVYFYDGMHPKPYFTLEGGDLVPHVGQLHLAPSARAGLWLHEHSFLYNLLAGQPPPVESDWADRRAAALKDPAAARDLTVRLIERTAHAVQAAGASFVLVVHPGRRQAREGSPWLDALRDAPELRGLRRIDMAQAYAERGQRLPALTLDPIGHLNAGGHARTAEILDEALRPVLAGR